MVLVVLCFLAVLGIGLAGYLAISNQSMRLSNRSYVKEVSVHLAEMGFEEALRALNNQNFVDWTSGTSPNQTIADWTLTGTTGTCTITLPAAKYGASGVTGAVKLRVDGYTASAWDPAAAYAANDMVWFRGVWFQCKLAHTNQSPPNAGFWTSAPATWSADANYNTNDLVLVDDTAYRCQRPHINHAPPNTTCWSAGTAVTNWSASTGYSVDAVVMFGGTAYRCVAGNTNQSPPNPAYWAGAPGVYAEGIATLPDNTGTTIRTQLHATLALASPFPNAAAATSTLTFSNGGRVDSINSTLTLGLPWSGLTNYDVGDNVTVGGVIYRCIANHTNHAPPNASYWTTNPYGYSAVLAGGNVAGAAVNLTNTAVSGYVAAPSSATSPYSPLFTYGTSPAATVKGPTSPNFPSIDLRRISRSPFFSQFDVAAWNAGTSYELNDVVRSGSYLYVSKQAPNLNNAPPNAIYWAASVSVPATPPVNLTLGTSGATLASNYFVGSDLLLDSGDNITIRGPVVLDIQGQLYIRNDGQIVITSTGSAEIHVSGRFSVGSTFAPANGIINQSNDPKKLLLVGTGTSSALPNRYAATSPYIGVIYMPNLTGTLDIKNEIFGAVSAQNINFSTPALLHYDTALRSATFHSLERPFLLSGWRELVDPAEKVTLP